MHVLHTDMKAISKNHNQSLVLVLFGSVWATRKRNNNQPMPRSRGAIVGTAVLSHTVPHNSIVHEEATQLWFPSLLGPTQAQRFCNCAPLINPSKPTLGDCRAVFATHAGGRHVVRKKNTYTQVHNNLSKCTPGETCVPVFHTKTCLLLPIRSCALKFVFQKINKSKNLTKEKISRKIIDCWKYGPLSDLHYFMLVHLKYAQSTERGKINVSGNLIANRIILQK